MAPSYQTPLVSTLYGSEWSNFFYIEDKGEEETKAEPNPNPNINTCRVP